MKNLFVLIAACGAMVLGGGCSEEDPVAVENVSFDKSVLELEPGQTETLTLEVSPSDAVFKGIVWSSSDDAVATVSGEGLVTGVGAGSATVSAVAGGKEATCRVTVSIGVAGISLDKTQETLPEGGTLQLTATILPEDATDKTVAWESSDTGVATVSGEGLVTAGAVGTTTITAKAGNGVSASCVVTVVKASKIWAVGDFYDVDGVKGVVVEIGNGGLNGKIVSMDEAVKLWATGGWNIGCTSETDGKGNTQKVKDYNADLSQFPAFKWCVDHGAGWYLPAVDEVYSFLNNIGEVNKTLAAHGGTPITDYYWTSTESDNSEGAEALYAYFSKGKPASYADFKNTPEGDTYARAMYAF